MLITCRWISLSPISVSNFNRHSLLPMHKCCLESPTFPRLLRFG